MAWIAGVEATLPTEPPPIGSFDVTWPAVPDAEAETAEEADNPSAT